MLSTAFFNTYNFSHKILEAQKVVYQNFFKVLEMGEGEHIILGC